MLCPVVVPFPFTFPFLFLYRFLFVVVLGFVATIVFVEGRWWHALRMREKCTLPAGAAT